MRCRICSATLAPHDAFSGRRVCTSWACMLAALEQELLAHRALVAAAVGEPAPEKFPCAVVPHLAALPASPVPITPEQRSSLEDHLRERVSIVVADEKTHETAVPLPDPNVPAAGDRALIAGICGLCRGACCSNGVASHAYLDDETLRRSLRARPGTGDPGAALVDEILGALPYAHVDGSCLFHTETGCSLPRDLRSRTCNTYQCTGLTEAQRTFAPDGDRGREGFVVIRHNGRIVRSAFVGSGAARADETMGRDPYSE